MLDRKISMWDIRDVEAFIRNQIRKNLGMIPKDDVEDMVMEGWCIMYYLNGLYDPSRDKNPSFAGYASFVLPKKLKEKWYSRQPEFYVKKVDGKRTYVRVLQTVSLDALDERETLDNREYKSHSHADIARQPGDFIPIPILKREE